MNDESNAMTEVALALAMAFFAIFILSAISMGVPQLKEKLETVDQQSQIEQIVAFELEKVSGDKRELKEEEIFIVYYAGNLFDATLRPINRSQIVPNKSYVLAVAPVLSLNEALEVKNGLPSSQVSVVLLDQQWLDRLGKDFG